MEKRIPGSMRTREALSELIEGHLSTPDARSQLVLLATRLIVEEALEAESRDALGRGYYEHGGDPGRGYRNRTGRLKTAEGMVNTTAPQIAGREEAFRSEIRTHLKGRSEALEDLAVEMLARGLSVRDIEDTFRNDDGSLLLSRTAVSEIGCGRTTRRSPAATSAATTSPGCSSTALRSGSARVSAASRSWPPGA